MDHESAPNASPKTGNKTVPTAINPAEFINTQDISETRRKDAQALLEVMGQITSEPAQMWGPSIIGFGQYHYKYASGREGDAPAVSFSPRKASLVIYGLTYPPQAAPLLEKLGKFKAGVACIYINKLANVDMAVLRELIAMTYQYLLTTDMQSLQSQHE